MSTTVEKANTVKTKAGKAVREAGAGTREVPSPARNPFPGLRPFREDEDHLFFGRESQTDAMVDKLAATRFLCVIGSSGCGKSSLVECGLRVALRCGLMASAGTAWRMAKLRPGGHPIASLARALAADGVLFRDFRSEGLALEEIVEINLRMSRLGLVDVCAQARLEEGTNLLVIVDQFEELFRYRHAGIDREGGVGDADEAAAFVNLLLEAKRQTRLPIHVVLTMRSDFLGDCARLPGLAEAINEGQYLVPRMSRRERRLAIEGPVEVAGAGILPVLSTRLLNDLGDDPDQLSILQHALNRIWAAWQEEGGKGRLNLHHYSTIGSMANALDRHAEKAFAELDGERPRELCKKLFQALTDKSTDARGVRRPTRLGTLCRLAESTAEELVAIIDVFRKPSRSFLMPPASEALGADTVIDISHESLMRTWRRLIDWADEEALSARTYRRLVDAAELHERDEASLWRDPELQLALDWQLRNRPNEAWASRYGAGFEQAMRFLDASGEEREIERRRRCEEDERERELERARAVADEQAARIEAQGKAARVQAAKNRVMKVAVVVSTSLAVLAGVLFWSTTRLVYEKDEAYEWATIAMGELARKANELTERTRELTAERDKLSDTVRELMSEKFRSGMSEYSSAEPERLARENAAIRRQLWKLVERGGSSRGEVSVTLEFVNPRNTTVRILTVGPGGEETPVATLGANGSESIELFENDIWIARVTSSDILVDTGVVEEEDTVLTLD